MRQSTVHGFERRPSVQIGQRGTTVEERKKDGEEEKKNKKEKKSELPLFLTYFFVQFGIVIHCSLALIILVLAFRCYD